jgi:carbon starvation protein CstA
VLYHIDFLAERVQDQGDMNTKSKTKGFGIFIYSIATVSALLGVALNFSGILIGTLFILLGITFACGTAIRLGHLKRW